MKKTLFTLALLISFSSFGQAINDEVKNKEVPFAIIEYVPEYPGCEKGNNSEKRKCMSAKIREFVQLNFNTDLAGNLGLYGRQRINVIFKIDKKGNVVGVRSRAPHPRLEQEAIRIINMLPKMKPGRQRGKAVIVPYSLPITFNVEDEETEKHFNQGLNKAKAGDYYGAINDYTKALMISPNFANAYYDRGISKHNLKDYNGAISDYTKAIELNPNFANAYNNRGLSKHNLKDYNGAISDYTKAIELNPNNALAYYNRGISKDDLKDYYGSISDYTKVIELNPNDVDAYVNRGASKEILGDLNGACADWKKAAELGDTDAAGWVANQCN